MKESYLFFEFLQKHTSLSEAEFTELINPYIEIRNFQKKALILEQGRVEDYLNFIVKGLVRKYYRKDGEEINTQISPEGHIIHAQESFHSRKPSEYTVQAIENAVLVSITYDNLEYIYSQNQKLERLGRLVITSTMVLKDRWQMNLIKLTPRERFLQFIHNNPELVLRVPQKYLASYLNIQPQTFSKFKHLVRGGGKMPDENLQTTAAHEK